MTDRLCRCRHRGGRRRTLVPLLAVLFALCAAQPAVAADLADVIDKVRPSVVGIGATYPKRQPNRRGDPIIYAGTGFVVGNGRQVITNYHVLPQNLDTRNRQQLTVFSGRGAYVINHRARVVRVDEERDLALLEFDGTPLPALELGDSSRVREGQEIAFTGFPLGTVLGLFPATHRGIVSAITPIARALENARDLTPAQLRRMRNPYLVFQLDAVAYPGNSGSPLFETDSGKVIGVINAVIVKRSRESAISYPSGISFAIPSHFIEKLLKPAP